MRVSTEEAPSGAPGPSTAATAKTAVVDATRRADPRLLAALTIAAVFHGGLLMSGTFRRTYDAYAIWISEAMLQQPRVEAVLGHYARFLERFPTVRDLAAASEDEVVGMWSGLGYYNRARTLRRAAIRARVSASRPSGSRRS